MADRDHRPQHRDDADPRRVRARPSAAPSPGAAPTPATGAFAAPLRPADAGAGGLPAFRRLAPTQQHVALVALQRTSGNAAVQRLLRGGAGPGGGAAAPASVQRIPPAVGVAIGAASFSLNFRPAGNDAFGNTNAQFSYSRDASGPRDPEEITKVVFWLDSIKGLGASWGYLNLVLRYDGHNILSAYTEQGEIHGYDGGVFGSEAAVNFSAVKRSQPEDPVTEAYLLVQGFNNPSGPGFQRFKAKILVTGDGRVEPLECKLTDGGGYARTDPWCKVGWD